MKVERGRVPWVDDDAFFLRVREVVTPGRRRTNSAAQRPSRG
jgi:hypothetical protein